MNTDEIQSLITKVLIGIGSGVATKYGIDGNTLATEASAAATLIVFAYSIWSHWNMKKVHEDSVTIPAKKGTQP